MYYNYVVLFCWNNNISPASTDIITLKSVNNCKYISPIKCPGKKYGPISRVYLPREEFLGLN